MIRSWVISDQITVRLTQDHGKRRPSDAYAFSESFYVMEGGERGFSLCAGRTLTDGTGSRYGRATISIQPDARMVVSVSADA